MINIFKIEQIYNTDTLQRSSKFIKNIFPSRKYLGLISKKGPNHEILGAESKIGGAE